jgi:ParB family chromosome partitioning protein
MAEASGRRGLGRGLSALLGEAAAAPEDGAAPGAAAAAGGPPAQETPIELLRRNPDQPRRQFSEEELEELAASIREKGVLQPILVRPAPGAPGEFQIVAGERRWRAAQRAGLHAVPVLVRDFDDLDVLEIGIVENVQRTDLNALEEAQGYKALMDRFGRTQDAVAQVVGKSRSHVANSLRLLNLPEVVREHLAAGRLSAGHARAIANAPDPAALARTIIERDLSVRQAETLARQAQARPEPSGAKTRSGGSRRGKDPDTVALENDLSEALGLSVEIADDGGRGVLHIRYESLEQLDDVCQRLTGG